MSESARGENDLPAVRPARWGPRGWSGSSRGLVAIVAAAAVFWLGMAFGQANSTGDAPAALVTATLGILIGVTLAAMSHGCRWGRPARRFAELLPRVQRGEAPIEQLEEVGGGVAPLVGPVQELVRELRQQRTARAELDLEIRQRVASRTDALERTIGALRQQAMRDALTGLFNRRFLDQYLPQCVQRHVREGRDLCLLMLDLDDFKALNDTLGHAAGDDLLRAVGQLIRSTARGDDVAFRCGGDEFIVLLPGHGAKAGRALAERLSSLVDALGRTLKVSPNPRLAVGMATLSACAHPASHGLLEEADRCLYEMKRARKSGPAKASQPAGGLHERAAGIQSSAPSRKTG